MTEAEQQELFRTMAYELGFEKDAGLLSTLWAPAKWTGKQLEKLFSGAGGRLLKRYGPETQTGRVLRHASGQRFRGMSGPTRALTPKRSIAREMVGFGAFGAPIGALMNPEDRLGGALKGFAGGALGGLGWRAGSNLARVGQAKLLGSSLGKRQAAKLIRGSQRKILTKKVPDQRGQQFWKRFRPGTTPTGVAKTLGQRAALGVIPTTAAFAGTHALASPLEGGIPSAETQAGQMPYYQQPYQQQYQQRYYR